MSTVLASAADRRYGWWLLNLMGSVHANTRGTFDAIVLYDLGLSRFQRRLAASIRGVELRSVPPFTAHWSQGFTWKPWIWTNLDAETVVYLDAGVTVLRRLDAVVADIHERGYFVVSQGRPLGEIVPADYYELYDIPREWGDRPYVAAGILGFRTDHAFYRDVLVRTFEDCLLGRSIGFSAAEAQTLNFGLHRAAEAVIRDAAKFRHDQTILNIRLFKAVPEPVVADLDQFGGFRSPRDHPKQVIWNHRRRGDFRHLASVPYRLPAGLVGTPFGHAFRARWWLRQHRWLFRPSTYVGKLRRIIAARRRPAT
jgi:hypothetical protein